MANKIAAPNQNISNSSAFPIVINTWPFKLSTEAGWSKIIQTDSSEEAVIAACNSAELDISISSVGFGGSPDEEGSTTLDAMIMDGTTMEVGAVGSLHGVKDAIKVAQAVKNFTKHTLIVGWDATRFARSMGFRVEPNDDLSTEESRSSWLLWQQKACQPNYRRHVFPDPQSNCGPYRPDLRARNPVEEVKSSNGIDSTNHDTIGAIAINSQGRIAVGTSTNGISRRIPGRVGDTPIPGAGGFADDKIGAAVGTGDGDVLLRFAVTFQAVQLIGAGVSPTEACEQSLASVRQKGEWSGALVAVNRYGSFGAACVGFDDFAFSVRYPGLNASRLIAVQCKKSSRND